MDLETGRYVRIGLLGKRDAVILNKKPLHFT